LRIIDFYLTLTIPKAKIIIIRRQRIDITGTVQGVGFRPAVCRIARRLGLTGFVYNDTKGVVVEIQGNERQIEKFSPALESGPDQPRLAKTKSRDVINIPVIQDEAEFTIKKSDATGIGTSEVTADMATCGDCLAELNDIEDFRHRYPFINCTNCGPRYSIIKSIPYDRPNTTMSKFQMCVSCAEQYNDIANRRFHAQPVACESCGPKIRLTDPNGEILTTDTEETISAAAKMLTEGKIVAIKGIGGFHLAVDALNEEAVKILRLRKKRDRKPFALMAYSLERIKLYAEVSEQAEQLLKSPEAPIVLLPKKDSSAIAPSVAQGFATLGFMLCYAPLHYMIFARDIDVLVMTSANISDEPLICDNDLALEKLGDIADAFLMHNRDVYRQIDDSVFHIIENKSVPLRRARGYVPTPIQSKLSIIEDILATGSDMKNTFCFAKQKQFICSEYIGDLANAEVYHHYAKSIDHLSGLLEAEAKVIACDLHPGYFSTKYAESKNVKKTIHIQHHWAHAASVLAENNIEGPTIALVCDGTGYGTDGAIWGCECLISSLEKFDRFAHMSYFPLPGADKASKEAIRPLLGLLMKAYGDGFDLNTLVCVLEKIEPDIRKISIIVQQIEKKINTLETSSLGRVFDAVAALAGVGSYNTFDAELPMKLEACITKDVDLVYDFKLSGNRNGPLQLDLCPMFPQIIADVINNSPKGLISAKFHNTLASAIAEMAIKAGQKTNLNTVVLSGGVFCNQYLLERTAKALNKNNFMVLFNVEVPSNDGGISLGQAAIAAAILRKKSNHR